MTFKVGDQAYIIENNSRVASVFIIRRSGDFYTVVSGEMGITLRASRLFRTRKEAEEKLPAREIVPKEKNSNRINPYDHINYYSPYGA